MAKVTTYDPITRLVTHRDQIIVCDIDEVVVNITPKWVELALFDEFLIGRCEFDVLKEGFGKSQKERDLLVLNRETANIQEWLKASTVGRLYMETLYFDNPHFYDDLFLTQFGKELVQTTNSKSLIFVSHTKLDSEINQSKLNFIERNFPGCKVHLVELGQPKSAVIKERIGKFDIFIDDGLNNIKDVMRYTDCNGAAFFSPSLGYNRNEDIVLEIKELSKEKNTSFGYYTRIM